MKIQILIVVLIFAGLSTLSAQTDSAENEIYIDQSVQGDVMESQSMAVHTLSDMFSDLQPREISDVTFEDQSDRIIKDSLTDWKSLSPLPVVNIVESRGDRIDHEIDEETEEAFKKAFEAVMKEKKEEENVGKESEKTLMTEVNGLVHDETRTKTGRDFFEVFYSSWESPPEAGNSSIRITEQPEASLGTIVFVKVNQNEIFKIPLRPGADYIQKAAEKAVQQTYRYLKDNPEHTLIY